MLKCIIIDDDQHAIENLKIFAAAFPRLKIVASYTDPSLALAEISKSDVVDLILLDIDMPKISGIELSQEIRAKTKRLIFTTSHTEYGYQAFKVHADDYLLKPFTLGEFVISLNKVFPEQQNETKNDFFFVRNKEDHNKMVNIKFKDVIAIESRLNYVMIHTTTKCCLTYMSLSEISNIFKGHTEFVQFHRSYIISHPHIDCFDGNTIKLDNGIQLTVGDYYRKSFKEFVSKYVVKQGKYLGGMP